MSPHHLWISHMYCMHFGTNSAPYMTENWKIIFETHVYSPFRTPDNLRTKSMSQCSAKPVEVCKLKFKSEETYAVSGSEASGAWRICSCTHDVACVFLCEVLIIVFLPEHLTWMLSSIAKLQTIVLKFWILHIGYGSAWVQGYISVCWMCQTSCNFWRAVNTLSSCNSTYECSWSTICNFSKHLQFIWWL